MRYFLTFIALFATLPLPAQVINLDATTTRAVVIGISDYQDDKIPDLKYAHRDAIAFAAWLPSPAGGNVAPGHIQLLLDKEATKGKVAMALTWLYEQSREGDHAIIYFSGHGDVEKKLFSQPGYLLCRDAPPVVYMSGGALSVTELQEVVATLSLGKKAEVLVITDACRAGTLAGAATGGPQQTTANLMNRFANEVKILSCQSNEFSIEGEQWGGGRGAFSYCLEDALYGLADRDKDSQIKLKEIGRYLEDHVPAQTDPQVQNPIVVGDREALVAFVDEKMLAQWEADKKQRQPNFSPGDMRGMADVILAQADTNIQQIYQAFLAAVEAGELMNSAQGGKSANECYEMLIHEPSIEQLHGFLKRNFVAALVDESQQVTNKLLKTDPQVVSDAWSRPFVFDHIPGYLERAVGILGEKHFLYKQLKAKQYFFEAKACRTENFPDLQPDSVLNMAVQKFEEALRFDSSAAYVHVEFGFLLWYKLLRSNDALAHAKIALELSPNWVYAHNLAGRCYSRTDFSKFMHHCQRAIELDSTFLLTYRELFQFYIWNGEMDKYAFYRDKYIQKVNALIASDPEKVPVMYRTYLGAALSMSGRLEEAEQVLLKARELSKGQDLGVWQFLGGVWTGLGENEKAVMAANKQIELAPFNPNGYQTLALLYKRMNQPQKRMETLEKVVSMDKSGEISGWLQLQFIAWLGEAYMELGREEEAKVQFQKILESRPDPHDAAEVNMKGRAYLGLGDIEAMQRTIDEGLKKFPGDVMVYYQAACLYSLAMQEQKSLEWLELALAMGMSDFGLIHGDLDLDWIREKPDFKALMKKYLPDQQKK